MRIKNIGNYGVQVTKSEAKDMKVQACDKDGCFLLPLSRLQLSEKNRSLLYVEKLPFISGIR
jgi:hypothetical protein